MGQMKWFKCWQGNWRGDTALQACSLQAQGLWFNLICVMRDFMGDDNPHGRLAMGGRVFGPPDIHRLVACSGASLSEVEAMLGELKTAGVYSCDEDGAIYCRRIKRESALHDVRVEAGKHGGNPILVKQTPNQNVSSILSPLSSSEGNQGAEREGVALPFPSKEFAEAWADWERYRRETKHKLSESTIRRQLSKLKAMGEARAIRCIEYSIENGWTGLYEPKGDIPAGESGHRQAIADRGSPDAALREMYRQQAERGGDGLT